MSYPQVTTLAALVRELNWHLDTEEVTGSIRIQNARSRDLPSPGTGTTDRGTVSHHRCHHRPHIDRIRLLLGAPSWTRPLASAPFPELPGSEGEQGRRGGHIAGLRPPDYRACNIGAWDLSRARESSPALRGAAAPRSPGQSRRWSRRRHRSYSHDHAAGRGSVRADSPTPTCFALCPVISV
jgi:hypothetical protein